MTDKPFSSLLFFLSAVSDMYYIKVYMCGYQSVYTYTRISVCVCMCKIFQKSGSLIVTARFHKEFSCCSSCYVSYQSIAIPGSLGSVGAKSCQDQGGRIALGMPQEFVCSPFLCHLTTNINWLNKIYPYLHQFWLIYTPRP